MVDVLDTCVSMIGLSGLGLDIHRLSANIRVDQKTLLNNYLSKSHVHVKLGFSIS